MFDLAETMDAFARPIPWPLLWIGACLGHAFWMTIGLNVLYAWPLQHKLLRFTRKIDLILIGLGPLLFFAALDPFDSGRLDWSTILGRTVSAYTVICFAFGTVVGPLCQIAYCLRRPAPQQVAVTGEFVDVAERLGHPSWPTGQVCRVAVRQVFQVVHRENAGVAADPGGVGQGDDPTDLHFCGGRPHFHRIVCGHAMKKGRRTSSR